MEPEYNRIRGVELAGFRRGNGRSSLLIVDRSGVYSTAHRRYIRKTRYHRYRSLAMDLAPLVKAYRSLQKLGMNSWPEQNEDARKEITWWKHWVMDTYWDAAPEKLKASAIERYFRARYQRGMVYPILGLEVAIVIGGLSGLMLLGRFKASFDFLLLLVAFCLVAWFFIFITERLVTIRWTLSNSEIHDVLEFELKN